MATQVPHHHRRSPSWFEPTPNKGMSLLALPGRRFPQLIEKAKKNGIGRACNLITALLFCALALKSKNSLKPDLAAIAMVPSHALGRPCRRVLAVTLGTNLSVQLAAQSKHPLPLILPLANLPSEVELYRRAGKALPEGVCYR